MISPFLAARALRNDVGRPCTRHCCAGTCGDPTLVDVTASRLIARPSTYACGSGHHCVVVEEVKNATMKSQPFRLVAALYSGRPRSC
jgi:hypothetical protein